MSQKYSLGITDGKVRCEKNCLENTDKCLLSPNITDQINSHS